MDLLTASGMVGIIRKESGWITVQKAEAKVEFRRRVTQRKRLTPTLMGERQDGGRSCPTRRLPVGVGQKCRQFGKSFEREA